MTENNNLIGQSEHFLSVLDHVSKVAPLHRPVLILGERGTGKELIARRIHYLSSRWDHALVTLNCAALSDGLIDSELFGHEAGAFSGAKGRHKGRFERAEHGTLFLDELGTCPLPVQEKLLRVIEYGEYERVGGHEKRQANVRLICATNQDLLTLVEQNQFRADLLDRIAFDVIHLPPLRERKSDILLLAEHFAQKMCAELGFDYFCGFSKEIEELLLHHPWAGNIRELKNTVERAVYRHGKQATPIHEIDLNPFLPKWSSTVSSSFLFHSSDDLPASSTEETTLSSEEAISSSKSENNILLAQPIQFPLALRQWQQKQEKDIVSNAMIQAKFNQGQAAQLLGLSYHQLRGLLRKHKLTES